MKYSFSGTFESTEIEGSEFDNHFHGHQINGFWKVDTNEPIGQTLSGIVDWYARAVVGSKFSSSNGFEAKMDASASGLLITNDQAASSYIRSFSYIDMVETSDTDYQSVLGTTLPSFPGSEPNQFKDFRGLSLEFRNPEGLLPYLGLNQTQASLNNYSQTRVALQYMIPTDDPGVYSGRRLYADVTVNSVTVVPEPSTYALMALGLVGLRVYRRKSIK